MWGAVIVGVAVFAGSMALTRSLDRMTQQLDRSTGRLDEIRDAVAEAKDALSNLQVAAARGGKGVDPNKRYTVETKGSPAMGPETAAVTIVEFSDFQCPFCGRVGPTLKRIRKEYGDQVRIVFKHQPLDFHAKAPAAHAAAEAAHRQGKFWEMHDKIFADQKAMSPEKYLEYATELELDVEQFKVDVASADVKKKVDADKKEAAKLGSTGTPGFFVNGLNLKGAKPFEAFKEVIDKELKKKKKA
jgi:protein-disulfide isomerase